MLSQKEVIVPIFPLIRLYLQRFIVHRRNHFYFALMKLMTNNNIHFFPYLFIIVQLNAI